MYFYFKIFWKKFLILVLLPYTHYYVIYFTFYYRCYSEKICQDLSRKFHVIVKNDKSDIMPNVKKKISKSKFEPKQKLQKLSTQSIVSMTDLRIDIFV